MLERYLLGVTDPTVIAIDWSGARVGAGAGAIPAQATNAKAMIGTHARKHRRMYRSECGIHELSAIRRISIHLISKTWQKKAGQDSARPAIGWSHSIR